jgi:hypothetical protein
MITCEFVQFMEFRDHPPTRSSQLSRNGECDAARDRAIDLQRARVRI